MELAVNSNFKPPNTEGPNLEPTDPKLTDPH